MNSYRQNAVRKAKIVKFNKRKSGVLLKKKILFYLVITSVLPNYLFLADNPQQYCFFRVHVRNKATTTSNK